MKRRALAEHFLGVWIVSALLAGPALTACSESSGDDDSDPAGGTGATGGTGASGGTSGTGGTGGSGGSAGSSGNAGTDGGTTTPPVGTFQVRVVASGASSGTTNVVGKVYNGPTPEALSWTLTRESGPCKLYVPKVPFCDPACGSAICVADGKCQAFPTAKTVGTVKVTGLSTSSGPQEITLTEVAKAYQLPGSVTLAYPPFAEGAPVRFAAAGGDFSAFALEAKGIKPLTITSQSMTVESGKPLTVTWSGGPSQASIFVKVDLSHHGGSKGKIECDLTDTGTIEIAAPLISELVSLGVAGFPTVVVTRRSIGSAQISAGRVDLVVMSDIEAAVTVPGVISCTGKEDCPAEQTCRANLTCG